MFLFPSSKFVQCMEEYVDAFIPVSDPRHRVVEQVVQRLVQRNHDIEGINSLPWNVHVVDRPSVNAFVLPVSHSGESKNHQAVEPS